MSFENFMNEEFPNEEWSSDFDEVCRECKSIISRRDYLINGGFCNECKGRRDLL